MLFWGNISMFKLQKMFLAFAKYIVIWRKKILIQICILLYTTCHCG